MIRALLFDFDGTFAETEETHRQAFNAAFAEMRLPVYWSEDVYQTLLHVAGGKERLASHFAQLDVTIDEHRRLEALVPELHARKTLRFAEFVAREGVRLRPGIRRLLAEAEAASVRVGIASTTTFPNVKAVLDTELGLAWERRFAVLACGDAVQAKKPAPDVYHYALAVLGLRGADVVAFEDSENGVAAAKSAGIFTVATLSRYSLRDDLSRADVVLPHLGDPTDALAGEAAIHAGGPFLTLERLHELWSTTARGVGLDTIGPSAQARTWADFVLGARQRSPEMAGTLPSVLDGIRLACQRIQAIFEGGAVSSQRDARRAARTIFLAALEPVGSLAGVMTTDLEEPRTIPVPAPNGRYLLAFDPLDGELSVEANLPVGSVFSLLRAREGIALPTADDFLRPGTEQIAAGYALYGPATMFVLTVGDGVWGFGLDRGRSEFLLTHARTAIPATTSEFAVDTSLATSWEAPLRRYVNECIEGAAGARGQPFALRWVGSPMAEVHRILMRGGVYVCPVTEGAVRSGLHLLCEANPAAMLIEQAGGRASTGSGRILDVPPATLGHRVAAILGARHEVERLERYGREHRAGLDPEFRSPLFNERSLFPSRRGSEP
jgi:HAD superfamily hydrolase (TIGR01509 family)